MKINRRGALAGLGLGICLVGAPRAAFAQVQSTLSADSSSDQSALFQSELDSATQAGVELVLPAGQFHLSAINLPSYARVLGVPGATQLISPDGGAIFSTDSKTSISIEGVTFSVDPNVSASAQEVLVEFSGCRDVRINTCRFEDFRGTALYLAVCSGSVSDSSFERLGQTGIHLQNSVGVRISSNHIDDCGNGGVRVWRYENGHDGSIITNNFISKIGSTSGNGQNGNGINIFQADSVIASNNVIRDCAFSAVRANSTNDTIIQANQCLNSSEVAIFSEFAFSGSIISNNLIDGAAQGISITNFSNGGHMAVCSGNIVRNITPNSPTNPDTSPVGIFAEADTAITGNVVDSVPGIGIAAGWGPYLRDVLIGNNVVRTTKIGISASVAEGAGRVAIHDNLVSNAETAAYAGLAWSDIVSNDLVRDADNYPNVTISAG